MSQEREGTAEDFAAMFGRTPEPPVQRLCPGGQNPPNLEADTAPERTDEQQLADALIEDAATKQQNNASILYALHGGPDEPPQSNGPDDIDFDGGVRETPSALSDPNADHNRLIGEALAASRWSR